MTQRTLSDLVTSALADADRHIKLASAADGAPKLAAFPPDEDDKDAKAKSKKDEDEKKSKKDGDDGEKRASATHALKLAEALLLAAPHLEEMVQKLAQSPIDAPGPKVAPTPQPGASSIPKPPTAAADPGKEGVGPQGTLATNDNLKTSALADKAGAEAYVASKIAQANLLDLLGQTEAAQSVREKLAQDPSSPQPNIPANTGTAGKLTLDPNVPTGKLPESQPAIAAMTKATAKDSTVREAAPRVGETPKKDNMVAATQMTTHGQKVSSLDIIAALKEKTAKEERKEPKAWDEKKQGRTFGGILGAEGAVLGGLVGGHAGHDAATRASNSARPLTRRMDRLANHGGKGGAAAGAVAGALAMGAGGRALGRYAAREQKKHDLEVAEATRAHRS